MRYVILIIVLACIAYLAVLFLAFVLPSEYEKTETRSFNVPVTVAYDFITNVENYPEHRDEYSAIQELSRSNERLVEWQAFMVDGKLAVYRVNEYIPNTHFSYQLLKSSNEMTGNWNFFFVGDSTTCTIEITEQSRMYNRIEKVYWYFFERNSRIDREFELIEGLED